MRSAQRGAMGLCPAVRPRPCPFGVPPLGTHDPKQSLARAVLAVPIRVCCASCTLGQGQGIPTGPPHQHRAPGGLRGGRGRRPPWAEPASRRGLTRWRRAAGLQLPAGSAARRKRREAGNRKWEGVGGEGGSREERGRGRGRGGGGMAKQYDMVECPFCDEVSKYEKLAKIGQGTFG